MRIIFGSPGHERSATPAGLGLDGHVVETAQPFADLPAIAQHNGPFDAAVISVTHCRTQALPLVREIRRRGLRIPVLVLASRLDPDTEQEALHAGADDVLAGPVVTPVLVARLQGLVRRAYGHISAVVTCGNVELDQGCHEVRVDGRRVRVTRREFAVLEMLMLRRGLLLTKEHFMSRLYGAEDGPDQRILDVFVCKLRHKLAAAGAAEIVRTVWGRGYVAEEPGPAALAAARDRFAAGKPRAPRAHLALAPAPNSIAAM
ncbi:response regulator transcription factor [Falsiroseomonas oryzae]|uniref:response regulator transcription factor n=1 Tax=Falsiroseomonas oryzae TaxID=2766473 RepID=UPI0022EB7B90|nr:response regulator transcription factor [Roseomonas sp. MO-31]